MFVYILTSLTGRKRNAGRTVIVQGFEFNRGTLIVTSVAVGLSLLPAIIASRFFGPAAMIAVPGLAVAAAFFFYEQRSRNGLQIRLYQALSDKRKADTTQFFICWNPVDAELGFATIVKSSEPVSTPTPDPADKRSATWTNPKRAAHRSSSLSTLLHSEAPHA